MAFLYTETLGRRALLSPGSGSNVPGKDEEAWELDISNLLLQVLVQQPPRARHRRKPFSPKKETHLVYAG